MLTATNAKQISAAGSRMIAIALFGFDLPLPLFEPRPRFELLPELEPERPLALSPVLMRVLRRDASGS